MEMTKNTTEKTTLVFKQVQPGTKATAPRKLRKFRGYKELVPDPYGLGI